MKHLKTVLNVILRPVLIFVILCTILYLLWNRAEILQLYYLKSHPH